jgi:hypothetical protein
MTGAVEPLRRPEDPPRGRTHPSGGYDEVVFDRAKGEYRCLLNGEPHRVDGPAVQSPNESRYYRRGALHRANGPAIVRRGGQNEYHLDGRDCGLRFAVIMAEVIAIAPNLAISVPEAYKAYVSGLYAADDLKLLYSVLLRHSTLEGALREVKEMRPRR